MRARASHEPRQNEAALYRLMAAGLAIVLASVRFTARVRTIRTPGTTLSHAAISKRSWTFSYPSLSTSFRSLSKRCCRDRGMYSSTLPTPDRSEIGWRGGALCVDALGKKELEHCPIGGREKARRGQRVRADVALPSVRVRASIVWHHCAHKKNCTIVRSYFTEPMGIGLSRARHPRP